RRGGRAHDPRTDGRSGPGSCPANGPEIPAAALAVAAALARDCAEAPCLPPVRQPEPSQLNNGRRIAMLHDFFTRLAGMIEPAVGPQASPLSNLDRAIQAAGAAHTAARRALAVAVAEEDREVRRREALTEKLSDLERRAVEALRAGHDDLAGNAAEIIAAV